MIIDGKKIAEEILTKALNESQTLHNNNVEPCLAIIVVGNNKASKVYVNNKTKACTKAQIKTQEYFLPEETTECELISLIEKLNNNQTVNGILVQLPLPKHINTFNVIEKINPKKDVDGFTVFNSGKLFTGNPGLIPCTAYGIIKVLDHEHIDIEGKHCVMIGRSNIVGKPTAALLTQRNATVTLCHSKTQNLKDICKQADILISAVGKPKFITPEMIKPGAVVIDVGINYDENGKLCGDVDFEAALPICHAITPVPGGIGPITVAMLVTNTILATKIQNNLIKEKED